MGAAEKQKIAILGGGMGSLAAAFELTSNPDWNAHMDITVYQMGWRLGGKGASGRNPEHHDRIEEHGLHVWLGFYHEAFKLMRQCLRAYKGAPETPGQHLHDHFLACNRLAGIEYVKGEREPWVVQFPQADGLPGDLTTPKPSLWEVLRKVYGFMKHLDEDGGGLFAFQSNAPTSGALDKFRKIVTEGFSSLKMKAQLGGVAVLELLPHLLTKFGTQKFGRSSTSRRAVHWLLDKCRQDAYRQVKHQLTTNRAARRSWLSLDLFIATVKGLFEENITDFDGMTQLDRYDFREFLKKYGASEATLQSPAVCGFYNLGFAYVNGNKHQASLAAGVILRFSLQMFFSYRGAMFWKMRGGMGDVVFVPLYKVLKQRGVRFEFFHKVVNLGLSEDQTTIASVAIEKQVALKKSQEYQPLISVAGEPCWPVEPLYEQLEHGDLLKANGIDLEADHHDWPAAEHLELQQGTDFDKVILGITLPALPPITKALAAANHRFATMLTQIPSVQTYAMQLWLKPDLTDLGWDPTVSLYDAEHDSMGTWSDMTHLLEVETWDQGDVGHLGYFCGVMEEQTPAESESPEAFKRRAQRFAESAGLQTMAQLGQLWPGGAIAEGSASLDQELLVGTLKGMKGQFLKANTYLSDRYVLAAKGTTQFRLKPCESGFVNLVLAGDWTENGLNYGCIEAATRSGLAAAQAMLRLITSDPQPQDAVI